MAIPLFYFDERTMKKTKTNNEQTLEFAKAAARIARDRNCTEITVIDLRGKSPATDFFVIATSTSDRQGRTVADEISEWAREHGISRFGRAGYEKGNWILMDFVDVVVHLFSEKYREYYDLELLWGDGEHVDFEEA